VAPHLTAREPRVSDLPESQFRDAMIALGGTGEAFVANDELLDLLLPVVRADFRLGETYGAPDEEPLSCPVTVFAGRSDRPTTEAFEAWEQHTSGAFRVVTLTGGHFALDRELP